MKIHTARPFNAEPPNSALKTIITPEKLHYRRTHTPVPVIDESAYSFTIGLEGEEPKRFNLADVRRCKQREIAVTLMCTGNRRSEFNTEQDGETMGLPWKNGSISTARWTGSPLRDLLKEAGFDSELLEDKGYRFMTLKGVEDYTIAIPMRKGFAKDGDVTLAYMMNGHEIPRDHGYPLRVIVPGLVGARSVKWLGSVTITKNEHEGMHQTGIAYKQLAPNIKTLVGVSKQYIHDLPPIDHVPVTSAVTSPEPGATVVRGERINVTGYAYSGAGLAIIRVDVSLDGGKTWQQAEFQRAAEEQSSRSGRAWAWVQWQLSAVLPKDGPNDFSIFCKAVDDQYNQQPHDPTSIWNIRGILNTSWGQTKVKVGSSGMEITEEAKSGDGTVANVGVKMSAPFQCPDCRQKFPTEKAKQLHWRFIHDPTRHQED